MIYKKYKSLIIKISLLSNSIFLLNFKKNKSWNYFLENAIFNAKKWMYFHIKKNENVSKKSWLFESY